MHDTHAVESLQARAKLHKSTPDGVLWYQRLALPVGPAAQALQGGGKLPAFLCRPAFYPGARGDCKMLIRTSSRKFIGGQVMPGGPGGLAANLYVHIAAQHRPEQ